jgi:hypothetical protein
MYLHKNFCKHDEKFFHKTSSKQNDSDINVTLQLCCNNFYNNMKKLDECVEDKKILSFYNTDFSKPKIIIDRIAKNNRGVNSREQALPRENSRGEIRHDCLALKAFIKAERVNNTRDLFDFIFNKNFNFYQMDHYHETSIFIRDEFKDELPVVFNTERYVNIAFYFVFNPKLHIYKIHSYFNRNIRINRNILLNDYYKEKCDCLDCLDVRELLKLVKILESTNLTYLDVENIRIDDRYNVYYQFIKYELLIGTASPLNYQKILMRKIKKIFSEHSTSSISKNLKEKPQDSEYTTEKICSELFQNKNDDEKQQVSEHSTVITKSRDSLIIMRDGVISADSLLNFQKRLCEERNTSLILQDCNIEEDNADSLFKFFIKQKTLHSLKLETINLINANLKYLKLLLSMNITEKLKIRDIYDVPIVQHHTRYRKKQIDDQKSITTLMKYVCNNHSYKSIHLHIRNYDKNNITNLLNGLNLQQLSINRNEFIDLIFMSKLIHINLSRVTDVDMLKIIEYIKTNQNIKSLKLGYYRNETLLEKLGDAFNYNYSINKLSISGSSRGYKNLIDTLSKYGSITELNIDTDIDITACLNVNNSLKILNNLNKITQLNNNIEKISTYIVNDEIFKYNLKSLTIYESRRYSNFSILKNNTTITELVISCYSDNGDLIEALKYNTAVKKFSYAYPVNDLFSFNKTIEYFGYIGCDYTYVNDFISESETLKRLKFDNLTTDGVKVLFKNNPYVEIIENNSSIMLRSLHDAENHSRQGLIS